MRWMCWVRQGTRWFPSTLVWVSLELGERLPFVQHLTAIPLRIRLSWPMAVPVGATRLALLGCRANISRSDGSEDVKNVMRPGRVTERWNQARL